MCELCTRHGDGKRWYLEAKNYSEDLLCDVRRRSLIQDIAACAVSDEHAEALEERFRKLDRMRSLPGPIEALVSWAITRRMKRDHFGQVVPIEDVAKVLEIVSSIVRLPCACRRGLRQEEHHYCLGLSIAPDLGMLGEIVQQSYADGPDLDEFEQLSGERALSLMREWETEGLVHTIWTFRTPFIGGICNCDRSDCLGMIATVGYGVKAMFKAEFVAAIDWDLCNGCRSCMRVCQFGAIGYGAGSKRAFVDMQKCYGCGLCRSVCPKEAARLQERSLTPEVANLW